MATLWFCIAAVMIAGYVVLDGLDLGAGIVALLIARDQNETTRVLHTIEPVWDGNEVWLLASGGALFFAFPALYASAFSGFYLALMIVLWLLILRGISIEFRHRVDSPLWRALWGTIFGLASAALALVFGMALGNVVRGVPLDGSGFFFLPLWTNLSVKGPVGVIDWYTFLVGAVAFAALAVHGSLWVILKTNESLAERTRALCARCWIGLVLAVLLVSAASFSVQPHLTRQFKSQPWGFIFPAMALAGLFGIRVFSLQKRDLPAFLSSGLFLAAMMASAAFGVFPNVLPSNIAAGFSLTIENAAAARHGLIVGLYWFIPGMALAAAYSALMYRSFSGKDLQEK